MKRVFIAEMLLMVKCICSEKLNEKNEYDHARSLIKAISGFKSELPDNIMPLDKNPCIFNISTTRKIYGSLFNRVHHMYNGNVVHIDDIKKDGYLQFFIKINYNHCSGNQLDIIVNEKSSYSNVLIEDLKLDEFKLILTDIMVGIDVDPDIIQNFLGYFDEYKNQRIYAWNPLALDHLFRSKFSLDYESERRSSIKNGLKNKIVWEMLGFNGEELPVNLSNSLYCACLNLNK